MIMQIIVNQVIKHVIIAIIKIDSYKACYYS